MGGTRRRDRRARPERRLDPRDGVVADVQAVGLRGPRDEEGARAPRAHAEDRRRQNYPSLNRAMQATYPPGSVFKPVTALAAMQEHLVSPYAYLPCTGHVPVAERQGAPGVPQLGPVRQPADGHADRACVLVRHVLLPTRRPLLLAAEDRGQPLQNWARDVRLRHAHRLRRRAGGAGPRADDRLAASAHFTTADRQALEAGRLDPSRDRPGRPARDAAADGALLRADRERRQARHAAPADRRREPERDARARCPPPAPPKPVDTSTRRRSRSFGRDCWKERTSRSAPRTRVFGQFPVSIAGKTGTAEKVVDASPATSASKNQSWWCGYGPTDNAKIVVCAVIENGGHGGTAAAPAAAQVLGAFFHVKVKQATSTHSRLMLEYAGSQRAGLQRNRGDGLALGALVRSLDWVLVLAVAGLVDSRPLGDLRRDAVRRRGRSASLPAAADPLRRRRRGRARHRRCSSTPTCTAVTGGRSSSEWSA